MKNRNIEQIEAQLPEGYTLSRIYSAFEGGYRCIAIDKENKEHRYFISFDKAFNAIIKEG